MSLGTRGIRVWAAIGLVWAICVACEQEPDNEYEPVSSKCLACLTEQKKDGCKAQFDACEESSACDDYVICQLIGHCYERQSNSGCEEALGCFEPSDKPDIDASDAKSARDLARGVEKCARSTCANTCGFVED
jgi:hypothetical protein